ncbi:hypothetical protein B7P43_G07044 [Cryptotermes secundus]|uniref:Endonuclease/exonuclease/phosphatase domain-containing protein n=1 Tax=Cryptotermes secundus TaxID=105785 RepID=A0A2J7QLG7_9NEOP|nr:hypothetical protein B7P43_G07044 [Cryptotermes secundus]
MDQGCSRILPVFLYGCETLSLTLREGHRLRMFENSCRVGVVDIATGYGLDDRGVGVGVPVGSIFSKSSKPALVSTPHIQWVLRQEKVRRSEGTSLLQDWNMECTDLESSRQIGEFENGNAEELGVCFRCQRSAVEKTRNGLIVTNTWFKKPKRRLYTWKAPGDWRRHQLDYILVKHRFRNSVKDVKTLPGADIDSDHNLLVAKFRTRLRKIIRFQKRRPRWVLEKLYAQRQSMQETLEEKLSAVESESRNAEAQWNDIKECMLDTISDLVGKVEKIARKPWVTQEMMSKMEERRKWKNVNNEEGRRKYRRLRKELKRATDRAKKEYLEKICNEIIEFQRTGRYDLMYMKTKELGWKENHGIQNIGIKDYQGNRIVDQRQVLKHYRTI